MGKKLIPLILLLVSAIAATAQVDFAPPFPPTDAKPNRAPQVSTEMAYFPIFQLNVQKMPGATLQIQGAGGQTSYCYWAVVNYQIGSVTGLLGCVNGVANTLSSGNYVTIFPQAYPPQSTGVDFLRTTSTLAPTGACNCAVATGVTSGSVNDQSNSLSSYTVPLFDPGHFGLTLTNEVVGSAASHLLLRQDGKFICDLSVGCGSGPDTDFYQHTGVNGTTATQRDRNNFIAGTNVTISAADNSGSNSTDVTINASSSTNPCGLFTSVLVTSAQLKALTATPVQIVAAPAAGNRVEPVAMGMEFVPGSTPYNTSGVPLLNLTTLAWNTFAGDYWYSLSGVGFLDQTTKLLYVQPIPSYHSSAGFDEPEPAADFNGQALMLVNGNPGSDPTLGDGQVLVTVQYCIVQQS